MSVAQIIVYQSETTVWARERTIHLAADTTPIQFAYLIAYFVRRNDDDGGHR